MNDVTSPLSEDFIAGLVAGEGSFMWIKQNGTEIPVFQLKMHANERPLFEMIKSKIGLKEKIQEYNHQGRNYVLLLVRKRLVIEQIIIPFFDNRLFGLKKEQFVVWKTHFFELKPYFRYKK